MTNSRDVAAARRTNTWSMVSSNEVLGRDSAAVQQYVAALRGDLLTPDDPEYDQARRVWNHMIDKRPALIARCASEADVLRSIEFARERGLTVGVGYLPRGRHNMITAQRLFPGIVDWLGPQLEPFRVK